jgi:hypothetical protein
MSGTEAVLIAAGILFLLVVVSYVVRVILWHRPVKGVISQPLPELDEVLLRGEYFRDLSLELQKKLDEVGEISQNLKRASEDWQQRYLVFESRVAHLSEKEKELREQVDSLGQIPLPAMEYFEGLLNKGERSAARRDYLLFGAGILATVALSLVLNLLGI